MNSTEKNSTPAYEAPKGRVLGTIVGLTLSKSGHSEFDSHKGAHHHHWAHGS